ncbi:fungal fruit body lectin [Athelia psychrophila]|uniref:Fungal fruit body lectin n=1 Tax=Athelia psychrophila TaxID=1759441 RepID=A0A165ZW80_9AGAM|nr:fungal fruit body lectin [Fibularhizoctonia sp. CBS 109695]KZP10995.1 fungal fruit body lectin [Fibularhizoctonia sp. CBS 109695]
MSYKISLRLYQTNPDAFFHVVEQTCLTKGHWSKVDGVMTLNMENSGTSGTVRLKSDTGEIFVIVVGVHNYKRWCDIVTDVKHDTGASLNPEYYDGGRRASQREKQLSSFHLDNAKGRKCEIRYYNEEGNDLKANIIMG